MKVLPARNIAVALLTLMATGCVSVIPEPTAPDAVYQLAYRGGALGGQELSGVIVVREPDGPRLLAGRQITAEAEDGGLAVLGTAQWADNATLMLQFALIDRLNAFGGNGVAVDNAAGSRGDVEIHWRLQEFGLSDSEARASFVLSILDGRTRAPLAQERLSASVPGSEVASLITASDQALADAAEFVRGFMVGYMSELDRLTDDRS